MLAIRAFGVAVPFGADNVDGASKLSPLDLHTTPMLAHYQESRRIFSYLLA